MITAPIRWGRLDQANRCAAVEACRATTGRAPLVPILAASLLQRSFLRCSCRLRGADLAAHDPGVLADLPSPGEPELLEQLGGRAEQEPGLSLSSGGDLGDRLDTAATRGGDLAECALQPGPCDSVAAMALVDENAGDPPARRRRWVLRVLTVVLEPELLRAAVLAPALREVILVEDQRGMRAARATSCSLRVRGSLTPRWYSV